jgi:selenide,water dikinase
MGAIEHMLRSNKAAARILTEAGATAATDITGFGLLGHLMEILRASGTGAGLALDALPALDGAVETLAKGITSSLQPQNLRLSRVIAGDITLRKHVPYPLLFDPQTAGGLLAAIPTERAEACVSDLRDAGYATAAIIGEITQETEAVPRICLRAQL